ncbi:heavy metal-responsive transcriptional regulator [Spirulina subsalsa]|uniref:heavy metal-responsive transcriptional regulator n=1 Tax=Spirulina subsalsa TaxID=54311 RepID=UPI0002F9ACFC|nr:heavy metal-responsive transcriptional regulator [Spirulina subsalsa]
MSNLQSQQRSRTSTKTLLKIGQVAQKSGLSVKTIRYYEDQGLLTPVVQRSKNGYRLFYPTIFNRLAFIRRAKSLGLSLGSIREILDVHDQGKLPCGVVKDRLLAKLDSINQQIAALELLKTELQGILLGWQDQPPHPHLEQTICPNLENP